MSAYFKIIRPVNLGIIVLTMVLLRFCIVEVYLGLGGASPALGYMQFALLVLATVLIAAGGYIINDISDFGVDAANKPGRMLLGQHISTRQARIYYGLVTGTGVVLGFYLAFSIGDFLPGFIFPAVAILLYLYSERYQKRVLAGNVMISLLSALVIVVLWLFEFFALKNEPLLFVEVVRQIQVLQVIVAGYALFAFFVSVVREIVKDIEDMQGDEQGGYRTFPVVYGVEAAKRVAMLLHVFTMLLLAGGMYLLYSEKLMLVFWYLAVAVLLLFVYILYQLVMAKGKKDFQFLSNAYKLIMLAGILSMQLFYISF